MFISFGNPETLVSDKGTAFTSQEFAEFLRSHNIKHRQIAVAAPWANGIVERINRFLKSCLKKLVEEFHEWSSHLGTIQYIINNTFHSSLKASPSKLLLGYDQRNHIDVDLVRNLNLLAKVDLNFEEVRNVSRQLALDATEKIKNYNKIYYDKIHKKPSQYLPGDFVLIRDSSIKSGEDKKLKPLYKGPYLIAKVLNNNRYVVKDIPGFNISSKPYNSILSPDRLKLWKKPVD